MESRKSRKFIIQKIRNFFKKNGFQKIQKPKKTGIQNFLKIQNPENSENQNKQNPENLETKKTGIQKIQKIKENWAPDNLENPKEKRIQIFFENPKKQNSKNLAKTSQNPGKF